MILVPDLLHPKHYLGSYKSLCEIKSGEFVILGQVLGEPDLQL